MDMLNWADIASRLKKKRKGSKLTIERLSELIEVSPSFISLIERGETGISVENLYKLSQVFNCSIDYLVTGNESTDIPDTYSRFSALNATIYDYTDSEIALLTDVAKFLKSRINVRQG